MTQKGDPHITLFITLSSVRIVSWILSQLNIFLHYPGKTILY